MSGHFVFFSIEIVVIDNEYVISEIKTITLWMPEYRTVIESTNKTFALETGRVSIFPSARCRVLTTYRGPD